jgi:hypothetical protein
MKRCLVLVSMLSMLSPALASGRPVLVEKPAVLSSCDFEAPLGSARSCEARLLALREVHQVPQLLLAQEPAPADEPTPSGKNASELQAEALSFAVKFVLMPLAIAIVGLMTAGLSRLTKKWGADSAAAEAKGDHDRTAMVLGKLSHFAEVTVQDIENNERAALEEAVADGQIDAAELAKLKGIALDRLKVMLGTEGLAELKEVLGIGAGAIDTFLSGVVEKGVSVVSARAAAENALKAKAAAVPEPSPS